MSFFSRPAISFPPTARLIEARDLYVDEALLTGEAYPAEKEAAPATGAARARPRSRAICVFMGSSVVSGTAKALVLATGRKAAAGLDRQRAPEAAAADRLCAWASKISA